MRKALFLAVIALLSTCILPNKALAQVDPNISYQEFYDNLLPYGQWIYEHHYGYVWIPNVGDDFRPYFTDGHWVMTEYGNTWVSDYPWGWACFHYGRWTFTDYYGWIWLPGTEWGPGWVAWRWGEGSCGWAPLYAGIDWSGNEYSCPDDWWVFLHPKYLYRPGYRDIWRADFMGGPSHTQKLLQNTKLVTNTYEYNHAAYYSGPSVDEVKQISRQTVQFYKVSSKSVCGADQVNNYTVTFYRPSKFQLLTPGGNQEMPANVIRAYPGILVFRKK